MMRERIFWKSGAAGRKSLVERFPWYLAKSLLGAGEKFLAEMNFAFHPEALEEYLAAIRHYGSIHPKLGERFVEETEHARRKN